jgi:hypothetical protein
MKHSLGHTLTRWRRKAHIATLKKVPFYMKNREAQKEVMRLGSKLEEMGQSKFGTETELTETQQELESTRGLVAHLKYEMGTHLKHVLKARGLRQMDVVAIDRSGLIYGQTARSRKKHGDLIGHTLERFKYDDKEQTAYIDGEFCTLSLEKVTEIKGKDHSFGYIKKAPADKSNNAGRTRIKKRN